MSENVIKEKMRLVYTLGFRMLELPEGETIGFFEQLVGNDNMRLQMVEVTHTTDGVDIKLDVETEVEIPISAALKPYKPVRLSSIGLYRSELGARYIL